MTAIESAERRKSYQRMRWRKRFREGKSEHDVDPPQDLGNDHPDGRIKMDEGHEDGHDGDENPHLPRQPPGRPFLFLDESLRLFQAFGGDEFFRGGEILLFDVHKPPFGSKGVTRRGGAHPGNRAEADQKALISP
jgi:hypothetical protein